ncbi:hypothetical protein GTZ78_04975 [Streptomyces sp. SID8361]|uniref:ABC transporter substrate-binding protein n=1 Tax=Streptomyces sp. MnatMP-M27 TaxID=1839768 RepID=UPI00144D7C18|nr:ABC transporter substrate-binding protein [Streptomyces sp. MnatMP-M27]MYU10058.1 hypothetical protein [Streptomyces sp. SID8361]
MIALVVAAVVLSAVAGCTKTDSSKDGSRSAEGKSLDKLVWAKPVDAASIDPHIDAGGNGADWEFFNLIYSNLVTLNTDQKVIPALATKWTQESPTTYIFDLRSGVKFSNGREMTQDDVVESLNRLMDPKVASVMAPRLRIKASSAVGTNQIRVELTQPNSSFLAALAMPMAVVLPMKEFDAGSFDPDKEMIGTGPYVVAKRVKGQSWTLKRNADFWGPAPKAAEIDVKIMTEDAARIAALKDGTADVTTFDQPDAQNLLKAATNVTTQVQQQNLYYRLDVNAKTSVFADHDVREALALSIDRETIINLALGGAGQASAAVVPSFGVCDASKMPFAQTDINKAKALVSAAGATGKTVNILASSAIGGASEIAQVLKSNLEKTGLKVKIEQIEVGPWAERVFSGEPADFDISISFFGNYADPNMVLPNYRTASASFADGYQVKDQTLSDLVDKTESLPKGDERDAVLVDTCKRIAENANVIPLVTKDVIVAYRGDKIVADIGKVDSVSVALRDMAQYGAK